MSNQPFKLDTASESEILLQVHILEESRIAGPGSSKKDICDILWNLTDLQPLLPTNISLEDVKTVIGKMKLVNETNSDRRLKRTRWRGCAQRSCMNCLIN